MSMWLSELANCLIRGEKYGEADSVLREAEQIVAETDERSHVAEIFRLKALSSAQSRRWTDGIAQFCRAIEWSRSRNAKLFELRAVRDLTRFQISEHKGGRGTEELRTVIESFPSALETQDLKEAKALLEQLA